MAKSRTSLSLLAHPHTPSEAVRRIAACIEASGPDSLRLQYVLEGDLRRVRIPPPVAQARRADKLWVHTCFEAFICPEGSTRYLELNFSPLGQWAAYRFESYRRGMAAAVLEEAPRLTLLHSEEQLELQAEVGLGAALRMPEASAMRGAPAQGRVHIAVSAVVEDEDGRLSYWALRHPPGRPDFHHPEGFSLALELPPTP